MSAGIRILVTLDGSPLSRAALPVAARLASRLQAEVVLLRVVPPATGQPRPAPGDLLPLVDLEERQADAALQEMAAAFAGFPVARVVLVGEHPADEIVAWLRHNSVDFVVMATHGRGGLRHLLAGSVTEAVLRSGVAPVMAVRPTTVNEVERSRA